MARLNWPGSPMNQASIEDFYLEDANGNQYGLLNSLDGDVNVNPSKIGHVSVRVRGYSVAALQGETDDGALTIPLVLRAPASTFGSAAISLNDILTQTTAGLPYVPFTAVSAPAVGNLPAYVKFCDSTVKTWLFVMVVNTAPIDQAPYKAFVYAYPMVPTPDVTMAKVGGYSTMQIAGVVDDPRLLYWTAA